MTAIILSFQPQFFQSLLTGKKHFEYRSRLPKGQLRAYLYLSSPVQQLVGYLDLAEGLDLSELLKRDLPPETRRRLANHRDEGARFASPIVAIGLFEEPISRQTARDISSFHPPQGFSYAKTYPELHQLLLTRAAKTYPINPDQSQELLGWFSHELLAAYPVIIPLPSRLMD